MSTLILATGARLTPFLLDKPARTGVLILPGGGYGALAIEHEGKAIGEWLNARGFDAWMLEYRVVSDENPAPLNGKPLEDVGLAVHAIRADPRNDHLGVWGFSAGGHLAAMAATAPEVKLDFAVLAYPVIDMTGLFVHEGSRRNLLGGDLSIENLRRYAPEQRVMSASATPPMFLFHTAADSAVPPQNSLLMAQQLAVHSVPFELHIYPNGPHGVGLADGVMGAPDLPDVADWSERLAAWLVAR